MPGCFGYEVIWLFNNPLGQGVPGCRISNAISHAPPSVTHGAVLGLFTITAQPVYTSCTWLRRMCMLVRSFLTELVVRNTWTVRVAKLTFLDVCTDDTCVYWHILQYLTEVCLRGVRWCHPQFSDGPMFGEWGVCFTRSYWCSLYCRRAIMPVQVASSAHAAVVCCVLVCTGSWIGEGGGKLERPHTLCYQCDG